jgi:hypothetical protein
MLKKPTQVELLAPADAERKRVALDQLATLVADRLAQGMPEPKTSTKNLSESVLLEPWFLPREVAWAILRLLPIFHQRKWTYFFEDWGCFKCGRKAALHVGNGLCNKCRASVSYRLKSSLKRRAVKAGPTAEQQVDRIMARVRNAQHILGGQHPSGRKLLGENNAERLLGGKEHQR